jgi:hypothetical protein
MTQEDVHIGLVPFPIPLGQGTEQAKFYYRGRTCGIIWEIMFFRLTEICHIDPCNLCDAVAAESRGFDAKEGGGSVGHAVRTTSSP